MNRKIVLTTSFKKELKRLRKRGKKLEKLDNIIDKLANDEILDKKYNDHLLVNDGKFKDCHECHVEPDWLLIYRKNDQEVILILVETGSHSDLF